MMDIFVLLFNPNGFYIWLSNCTGCLVVHWKHIDTAVVGTLLIEGIRTVVHYIVLIVRIRVALFGQPLCMIDY